MSVEKSEYFNEGYFSGENPDSPYPKDGRYVNPDHPVVNRKFRDLLAVVRDQLPAVTSEALFVLDVGCGPAHTERIWKTINPRLKVANCDMHPVAGFGASNLVRADQVALPYTSNTFNVATSWDVIEHTQEESAPDFFKEAYRVLDYGGVLAVRTPNKRTWTDKYRRDISHLWFPTPEGIRRLMADAGFENIKIGTRGFPGTALYQKIRPEGDLYLPFGGGIIIATGKKEQLKP